MSNRTVWMWIWFFVLNVALDGVVMFMYPILPVLLIWFVFLVIDIYFIVDLYCNHLENGENE